MQPDELTEALKNLKLAPLAKSPQEIWYEAGYQKGRRGTNLWRGAAAVTVLVSIGLALSWRSLPGPGPQVAHVPQSTPSTVAVVTSPAMPASDAADYLRLCNEVAANSYGADLPVHGGPSAAEFSSDPDLGFFNHGVMDQ
jgi:hypothetical protein